MLQVYDIDKLVLLYEIAVKTKSFKHGDHISLTDHVMFYVDKGSFENKTDPKEMFFSFTAFGFEVRHASNESLMIDGEMKNFSDFNFEKWYEKVRRELEEDLTVITVNGKKYKLIEPSADGSDEELPF